MQEKNGGGGIRENRGLKGFHVLGKKDRVGRGGW